MPRITKQCLKPCTLQGFKTQNASAKRIFKTAKHVIYVCMYVNIYVYKYIYILLKWYIQENVPVINNIQPINANTHMYIFYISISISIYIYSDVDGSSFS